MEAVAKAPPAFTWRARNPARTVLVGENALTFGPNGGMVYALDLDKGRRPGPWPTTKTSSSCRKYARCSIMPVGSKFPPRMIPVSTRHLHRLLAGLTLTDKVVMEAAHGREITGDCLKLAELVFGDITTGGPVIGDVINVNSPLRYDERMLGGLITYARGRAGCCHHPLYPGRRDEPDQDGLGAGPAERRGPGRGGPDPAGPPRRSGRLWRLHHQCGYEERQPHLRLTGGCLGLAGGAQLARYYKLPYRGSGSLTNAKTPDAQAAYETMWTLWPAVQAHTNLVMHAVGWLEGGLTASYEKFMIDVANSWPCSTTFWTASRWMTRPWRWR